MNPTPTLIMLLLLTTTALGSTTTTTLPTCVGTEISDCIIYENDQANCEAGYYSYTDKMWVSPAGYYQCDFGEVCYHNPNTQCEPRQPIEPPSYTLIYIIIFIVVVILAYSTRKKKKKKKR